MFDVLITVWSENESAFTSSKRNYSFTNNYDNYLWNVFVIIKVDEGNFFGPDSYKPFYNIHKKSIKSFFFSNTYYICNVTTPNILVCMATFSYVPPSYKRY